MVMQEIRKQDEQIIIKDLSLTYEKGIKPTLDNLNLAIGTGLFGLLGANGAGKSSLMQILCTLQAPSQGSVSIAGFDVVEQPDEVRKIIGYLPQVFGAWRLQRVREVLDTLAALSGMKKTAIRKARIEQVLQAVGLSELGDKKVKQLSGGMLRRLGVAQALIHDPKIIIMDEPSVGLDPAERQRFRQLIAELAKDKIILLSTHIVSDLGATCADLALIHEGKIEFRGSPAELIAQAKDHVYEVHVTPTEEQQIEESADFEVVSRRYQDGMSVIRGISRSSKPPQQASAAEQINLEEAYLAFTLHQGRELNAGDKNNEH